MNYLLSKRFALINSYYINKTLHLFTPFNIHYFFDIVISIIKKMHGLITINEK